MRAAFALSPARIFLSQFASLRARRGTPLNMMIDYGLRLGKHASELALECRLWPCDHPDGTLELS